ncbi:hypothetical protein H6F46_09715 [Limnothrix sp. FACHB-1083]|uniref:hypothetical protein n=1 Tax=unclassified Limnothrix TaxID=2632864 RepID=UPI001680C904|nr:MULTISPECIES: hypothetical protein [unclassified Limnothrix]MBD2160969.1 hypothetical protein [Limnothrix sp. FACHB-1083]MBD2191670.1 hypothetical protein [Limnothrix sp. FACHB-1088]
MHQPPEDVPPLIDRTELGVRDRDLDPIGSRLRLYLYYAPIAGWLPALLALRRSGLDEREFVAAKRSVQLAIGWAIGLAVGSTVSEQLANPSLSFLLLQSAWTSTYCLICVGLMVSVWRRRSWAIGPGRGRSGDRPDSD